jgi:hypothetical protein
MSNLTLTSVWQHGPDALVGSDFRLDEFELAWHAMGGMSEVARDWYRACDWYAPKTWGAPRSLRAGDRFGSLTVTTVEVTEDGRLVAFKWSADDGRQGATKCPPTVSAQIAAATKTREGLG